MHLFLLYNSFVYRLIVSYRLTVDRILIAVYSQVSPSALRIFHYVSFCCALKGSLFLLCSLYPAQFVHLAARLFFCC